jgi:hypothetical protein
MYLQPEPIIPSSAGMTGYICKTIEHRLRARANQLTDSVVRTALNGSTMSGHMTLNRSLGHNSTASAIFPLHEKGTRLH